MSKKIFFVRGLVRETRHWGKFLDFMKDIEGYKIDTLQIPGTGNLNHEFSPNKMDTIVDKMRDQYLEKKADENIIVAISLGGMIATNWTNRYPNDFLKAIMINTSLRGINPLLHRLKPKSILTVAKTFVKPKIEDREKIILEMISNNKEGREAVLDSWIKIQTESPVAKKSAINQIIAAITYKPPIIKPPIPVKLITGKGDRMVSYKCSVKISEKWDTELAIHDRAGHDIPIDAPEWLKNEIIKFL